MKRKCSGNCYKRTNRRKWGGAVSLTLAAMLVLLSAPSIGTFAAEKTTYAQYTAEDAIDADDKPDLRGESVYEIMVDRFYDGDPANNATGKAFRNTENSEDDFRYMHGGDWQGIIDKIGYIKGMGYTAIWISPVGDPQLWGMPADGRQWPTAYHGYNVYDPNRANRYFGCEDPEASKVKLKELVDTCHANGIKVIIDVVPNHVGDYLQGTGNNAHYIDNNNLKPGTQTQPAAPFNNVSWYHNQGDIDWNREQPHNDWSTEMLETHDLGGLDDLDYENSAAKEAMLGSIKGWFDYTGADGARVDAAKCMKPSDIHELQSRLGVPTFGENFDMDPAFVSNWVGDNAETGMLDFPLFQAVVNDFAYGQNFNDTSNGALSVTNVLAQDNRYGSHANDMVTFIDNHDRNRFLTEAGGDVARMRNALSFIFTVRGIPVVFQGTEQNKGNANSQIINGIADTWNRWDMVQKDCNGNVVADHFNTDTDTYQYIAELNRIRSKHPALADGSQLEMWTDTNFYAFSRISADDEVISAFHNCGGSRTVTMPIRRESSLKAGDTLVNAMNPNDVITVSSDRKITITLNGNSSKIYVPGEGQVHPADMVSVTFRINNAQTYWGQNVYVTGNIAELGDWSPSAVISQAPACANYPAWTVMVDLPAGTDIEFKAVKIDGSGNIEWQSGNNHTYTVPDSGSGFVEFDW